MTSALVVDDSTVDRELVRALLNGSSSLEVVFAGNGAEALEQVRREPPQIIITDLHMPTLDGLQLVEAVHEHYAAIPIVLITGKGSEDLAVQALKKGTADYVPKACIARDLIPTVMRVLAVSRANHNVSEVQRCWEDTQCSFRIPNDYNLISPLVEQLMQVVVLMKLFDATEQVQLAVALEESISNALYHGNLELTSEQLSAVGYDLDEPTSANIIDERRMSSPYQDRAIYVNADINRQQATFTVRDEGHGFDHTLLPKPEAVVASETQGGRGLTKMLLFFDELMFNDQGNAVTMVKRT